jgi:hypothetical protein
VWIVCAVLVCASLSVLAQQGAYDGLANGLSNIFRTSEAKTFSISPENFTGEKGKGGMATEGVASAAARDLGRGWKVNPFVVIDAGKTFTLGEITGTGSIQHIWMTPTGNWRYSIMRIYWDDEAEPSVEVPVGDFFAMGWGKYAPVYSLAICVNPGSGCDWPPGFALESTPPGNVLGRAGPGFRWAARSCRAGARVAATPQPTQSLASVLRPGIALT